MSSAGTLRDRVSAAVWSDPWYDNKRERNFKIKRKTLSVLFSMLEKSSMGRAPLRTAAVFVQKDVVCGNTRSC